MNIEIKSEIFGKVLADGIKKAPKDKKYVALHVSCGHMSIFCEYYDDLQQIEKEKGHELVEPQCYSNIKIVYDLIDKEILFCDFIGMVWQAHDQWENQKDLPNP
jgi:hypothetical protein